MGYPVGLAVEEKEGRKEGKERIEYKGALREGARASHEDLRPSQCSQEPY
jgi:hypothetical protein